MPPSNPLMQIFESSLTIPTFGFTKAWNFIAGNGFLPSGEFYQLDDLRIRRIVRRPKVIVPDRKPVVLVHGFAANAYTFRELQPALTNFTLTHNLDLPGMGYSDRHHTEYSLEFYVDFLKRYLDQEGIESCDFVGHSLGGAILFMFALAHPERVHRLTLFSPLVNFKRIQTGLLGTALKAASTPVLAHSLLAFHGRWFAKLFLEQIMVKKHLINKEMVEAYYDPHRLEYADRALYQINRMLSDAKYQEAFLNLSDLSMPCLVLWGEEDPLLPIEDAALLSNSLKNMDLATFSGAGHMLMHERPREVNAKICKFLFT